MGDFSALFPRVRPHRVSVSVNRRAAVIRALGELGWRGDVMFANRFPERLRGLIGRAPRPGRDGDVLAFCRCGAVHTCFMTRAIDVAFADEAGHVLQCHRSVQPWSFLSCPRAFCVLERFSP